jgi:hypothetical protein
MNSGLLVGYQIYHDSKRCLNVYSETNARGPNVTLNGIQHRQIFKKFILLISIFALLTACGDDDWDQVRLLNIDSVNIRPPISPTNQPNVSLSGKFFYTYVKDPLNESSSPANADFNVSYSVSWHNHLTGEQFSEQRSPVIDCVVIMAWIAYCDDVPTEWSFEIPLAPGDNQITVTVASGGSLVEETVLVTYDPNISQRQVWPTVVSVFPESESREVSIYTPLFVTLSKEFDASKISTDIISIGKCDYHVEASFYYYSCNHPVNGGGSVEYSNSVLTFTPKFYLETNTKYQVTINLRVHGPGGDSLLSDYSWTFITEDTESSRP